MTASHPTRLCRLTMLLGLVFAVAGRTEADGSDWLTDADVEAILARGTAGVFYAWSPHMPLSVDGLQEILAAGERLDLVVVPVLSSHANVTYARVRIEGRNLPDSVLRRSRSNALVSRDLFVHAPAILVFERGRFISPMIPGFRYAADYGALIGRFLETARQPDL